jgi:hypothetical protein
MGCELTLAIFASAALKMAASMTTFVHAAVGDNAFGVKCGSNEDQAVRD